MPIKPWKSIDEQLELLKSRNLTVNNDEEAKEFLLANNYFRISGYTLNMRSNDWFYDDKTMDNVMECYMFDRHFRTIIMGVLENIEITYKSLIAYVHAKNHGPLGYERSCEFSNLNSYAAIINKIIGIKASYENNSEIFLKHYVDDLNGRLPFWAAIELLNFTDTSKIFQALLDNDKKEIVNLYLPGKPSNYHNFVSNWLRCASVIRNIAAHRGRLYNRTMQIKPHLGKNEKNILLKDSNNVVKMDKLFPQIIAMQNLYPDKGTWQNFCYDLFVLTETFPTVNLKAYGFPDDWKGKLENRV